MASRNSVNSAAMRLSNAKTRNPAAVPDARAALAAERIALYVEKVLADAPPLTDAQRDRISHLLSGGPDRG